MSAGCFWKRCLHSPQTLPETGQSSHAQAVWLLALTGAGILIRRRSKAAR